jgi:hypothetical protein
VQVSFDKKWGEYCIRLKLIFKFNSFLLSVWKSWDCSSRCEGRSITKYGTVLYWNWHWVQNNILFAPSILNDA